MADEIYSFHKKAIEKSLQKSYNEITDKKNTPKDGGKGMSGTRKRRRKSGAVSIAVIVLAFLVVMAVQICRIKAKDAEYAAREQELKQEYEEETQRASEIDDLETYMNSSQYIEDVAKSRLGLTYKNEIIFKEKKE